MAHNVDNKSILFILGILSLIVAAIALNTNHLSVIHAQDSAKNFRLLLEGINEQIKDNQGFIIAIQFQTPIVEGEPVWIIPDRRDQEGDEVSIVISEIGDDYVCFNTLRGSANYIMCTPYSNIVSINYLID